MDLVGIERAMVACHKPKSLQNIIIPSSMKYCEGVQTQVSNHIDRDKLFNVMKSKDAIKKEKYIFTEDLVAEEVIEHFKTFTMVNNKVKRNHVDKNLSLIIIQ